MRFFSKYMGFALAMAVAGCQSPAWQPATALRIGQVDLNAATGLTVRVDAQTLRNLSSGSRSLLYTVADIEYVTVLVQPQGQPAQSQTLTKAQLVAGVGSVTFNNLPAVPTTVRISAFDVKTAVIGSGSQSVNVLAGAPTVVNFQVPLNPTYIIPIGSLSGSVGFTDGPTIAGTPAPGSGTTSGTVLQTFTGISNPDAINFDSSGNTWIAAYGNDQVHRYTAGGQAIDVFKAVPGPASSSARPSAIAFDPFGNAWITNYTAGSVSCYGQDGTCLLTVPVGLYPVALAFDPSGTGNLWIVNEFGNNVTVLNVFTSQAVGIFKTGKYPMGICFDAAGNAYIPCMKDNCVTVLGPDGSTVKTMKVGTAPINAAFDSAGHLWVVNNGSNNVTKYDANGGLLGTYATKKHPSGLAFDPSGNAWISNLDDQTVSRYSSSGTKLSTYQVGKGARTLAADKGGNIWVLCFDANTVYKLAP